MKHKLFILAIVAAFVLSAALPMMLAPLASAQSGNAPVTLISTQGTLSAAGQYVQTTGNFVRIVEGSPTPTPTPTATPCQPVPGSPGGTVYSGSYTLSNNENGDFILFVQNNDNSAFGSGAPEDFPDHPVVVEQGAATVTLSINTAAGTGDGSISFTSGGAGVSGNIVITNKITLPATQPVPCGSPSPTPTATPATPTPTPTATPTASPTPTVTPSPTVTPTPARPTQNDFDGDGRADVSVYRPGNGAWYLNRSTMGFAGLGFGLGSDKLAPADYDGDGKTDIAVFRDGNWYIINSSNNQFRSAVLGQAGDAPVPADYDGDKRSDLAVFRPSNGTWYVQRSTAGALEVQFGAAEDKPVAADYTGDGAAELAVFRPSNGTWYVSRNFQSKQFDTVPFGQTGDRPVAADYDGDNRTDFAVFRPANGAWYLLRSSAGFTATVFGFGTDTPAPADYDGDGRADIAVFRDGNWYIIQSGSGQFRAVPFGQAGDRPVQSAYVQ